MSTYVFRINFIVNNFRVFVKIKYQPVKLLAYKIIDNNKQKYSFGGFFKRNLLDKPLKSGIIK